MSENRHPLLTRQLKRVGVGSSLDLPDTAAWVALLDRVTRAYEDHDQERYLLERSQHIASAEMAQLHASLRADRDQLDARVRERTQALQVSESRLQSLLSLSADWIWEQDASLRYTYISDGMEAAIGVAPALLIGKHLPPELYTWNTPADAAEHLACIEARRAFRDSTFRFAHPSGEICHVRISGEPVFDAEGRFTGYRGVGRNVTRIMLAEHKVFELAHFDSLTGLPNRNMFLGELTRMIARASRHDGEFAVCFIDLDRFKTINDALGHGAGDELLMVMAQRLRESLRVNDIVARLGGDEFVVLLEGSASAADHAAIAQKMLHAISEPLMILGCTFLVTGSIGISLYPADGRDAATLLKHADAAMYLAKSKGKNNIQFYSAELAEMAARHFDVESALRLGLTRNELLLHYQPKVGIAGGRILGLEALARWMHPTRGMVPPAEFIPVAEERGLIIPLGRWVIQEVCRQIRDWRRAGVIVPPVAVNLSAWQFSDQDLVSDMGDAMAQYGVGSAEFEVELTESVLMTDPERANAVLQRLHRMGVKISIDDFGTGYSSLSYLKRFPADALKIDRSFVCGLPDDADDKAITQAVIAMAHALGLKVIAEGVESHEQLDMLRALGCDEAQGYLFGKPMPAAEIAARLECLATGAHDSGKNLALAGK